MILIPNKQSIDINPLTSKLVRMGDHNLESTEDDATAENYNIVRTIHHKEYNSTSFENDVALLVLHRNVTYTDEIHPVCLPVTPEARAQNFTRLHPYISRWMGNC